MIGLLLKLEAVPACMQSTADSHSADHCHAVLTNLVLFFLFNQHCIQRSDMLPV